jgi:hypothetical protein
MAGAVRRCMCFLGLFGDVQRGLYAGCRLFYGFQRADDKKSPIK